MSAKLDNNVLRIDSLLREAAAVIWKSLPGEKRNAEDLQSETLRLVMRVIQNFCDDLAVFCEHPVCGDGIYARVRERYPNSGKPWSAQSDEELKALFESGNPISDLSLYFQRTGNGIRARLVKLGLLEPGEHRSTFAAAS
ncbi:MAG: hypothetical protein NVS9B12_11640 [Vulcanimicrobiaceae bacterium]